MDPGAWLGPDILEVIDTVAAEGACRSVVVCACGFVPDHFEVLHDLDVEAAARPSARGLALTRPACVNDDAALMAALA